MTKIEKVAAAFIRILTGLYHHRIEYPSTQAISSGRGGVVPVPRQGTNRRPAEST